MEQTHKIRGKAKGKLPCFERKPELLITQCIKKFGDNFRFKSQFALFGYIDNMIGTSRKFLPGANT